MSEVDGKVKPKGGVTPDQEVQIIRYANHGAVIGTIYLGFVFYRREEELGPAFGFGEVIQNKLIIPA